MSQQFVYIYRHIWRGHAQYSVALHRDTSACMQWIAMVSLLLCVSFCSACCQVMLLRSEWNTECYLSVCALSAAITSFICCLLPLSLLCVCACACKPCSPHQPHALQHSILHPLFWTTPARNHCACSHISPYGTEINTI